MWAHLPGMVNELKKVHQDKPGARTAIGIVDSPKIARIDPSEVLRVASVALNLDLEMLVERQKAAVCIAAGVPVDYLGDGKWQLRYPCAIVADGDKLKVKVEK